MSYFGIWIYWVMVSIMFFLSYLFLLSCHPLSSLLLILIQSMNFSFMLSLENSMLLISFSFILSYSSGMLVVFSYTLVLSFNPSYFFFNFVSYGIFFFVILFFFIFDHGLMNFCMEDFLSGIYYGFSGYMLVFGLLVLFLVMVVSLNLIRSYSSVMSLGG
uniref:NADH dehydrogenase subunit 6 n=1 Tax=Sacculina confragosa TaxID=238040 RepID=UPI002551FA86|nr:NADH dehydrogenase subunit 6 [Sacculina confragosa]WGU20866.1 NADH dehydrogenase subunit 6 [Sacculina confragosa]